MSKYILILLEVHGSLFFISNSRVINVQKYIMYVNLILIVHKTCWTVRPVSLTVRIPVSKVMYGRTTNRRKII